MGNHYLGFWGLGAVTTLLAVSTTSGCAFDTATAEDEAELAAVSQAINGAAAVGVIPVSDDLYGIGDTCPREATSVNSPIAELVTLRMDDEDDDNQSKFSSGWLARSSAQRWGFYLDGGKHTVLRFCRVEGRYFTARTTSAGDTANFYAVLSLGTSCPADSTRVSYFIDNEDDANENKSTGSFAPNSTGTGKFSSTTLFFCLFRSAARIQTDFVDLGARYAVFHTFEVGKQPPWVISKHSIYSDDEDDTNNNHVVPGDAGADAEMNKIVQMGTNTTFNMARVQ